MKILQRPFIAVLLLSLIPSMTFADSTPDANLTVSEHGDLHYLKKQDGSYYFSGRQKLVGLLVAHWGKDLTRQTGDKKLYLQFLPEKEKISLLPVINDEYKDSNKLINLNYFNDSNHLNIVKKYFTHIPVTFLQNKEGVIEQPAMIVIEHYSASVDCDYRYYYGEIESITPIKSISATIENRKGCNSYLFEDRYLIQSEAGYSNLYKEINNQFTILKKLTNGTTVTKLKTVNDWLYVDVESANSKSMQGYVHKSQVTRLD